MNANSARLFTDYCCSYKHNKLPDDSISIWSTLIRHVRVNAD